MDKASHFISALIAIGILAVSFYEPAPVKAQTTASQDAIRVNLPWTEEFDREGLR